MVDDDGLEYAVPHYRDPEKAARIVSARRRGERVKDIAARERVSHQRVSRICRDAGLIARRSTTPPSKACAECGKLLRNRSAVYCSRKCAAAALYPNPAGKHLYELRRDGAAILLATHDIFRAMELGTTIGIMKSGELVEQLDPGSVTGAELEKIYLDHMRGGAGGGPA